MVELSGKEDDCTSLVLRVNLCTLETFSHEICSIIICFSSNPFTKLARMKRTCVFVIYIYIYIYICVCVCVCVYVCVCVC